MPPALDKTAHHNTAHTNTAHHAPTDKIFTLSMDDADIPLVLTRKALQEFELQGLEAMDECLIELSERLTPANAPHMRPKPLDLVGQMMFDSAHNGNLRKLMLCALWVGHHYPSLSGLSANGAQHTFIADD